MKNFQLIKIVIQFQLLLLFLLPIKGFGKIIHVPGDYLKIQNALNVASEGDTVQVAPGRYFENIKWPETNDIKLIGGGEDCTIIDGGSMGHVIEISFMYGTAVIQGFKII